MIRKISIGLDMKQAMHYVVGKYVMSDKYMIHMILAERDYVDIYVEDEHKQVFKWKSVANTTPHSLEYILDFE